MSCAPAEQWDILSSRVRQIVAAKDKMSTRVSVERWMPRPLVNRFPLMTLPTAWLGYGLLDLFCVFGPVSGT